MNVLDYHIEKAYVFCGWKYRNGRFGDISSDLYVLSFGRTKDWENDSRTGYRWFIIIEDSIWSRIIEQKN